MPASPSISPLSPSASFRRVRAILSPLDSSSDSYTDSLMSGPSSPTWSPSRHSTGSNFSAISLTLRNVRNLIRRKPSAVELEFEEERRVCHDDLLDLVEPRPVAHAHVGGIDEVLFGRL